MTLEEEFRSKLKNELLTRSEELSHYFSVVIGKGTSATVLDYEFHRDSIDRGRPVICHTAASPFEGHKGIISKDLFRGPQYIPIEDQVWQVTTEEFFRWFYSCWVAAGGQHYEGNAYLSMHDDINSFDLKSGKWVDNAVR